VEGFCGRVAAAQLPVFRENQESSAFRSSVRARKVLGAAYGVGCRTRLRDPQTSEARARLAGIKRCAACVARCIVWATHLYRTYSPYPLSPTLGLATAWRLVLVRGIAGSEAHSQSQFRAGRRGAAASLPALMLQRRSLKRISA
jgi:hypothetical protein